MDSVDNAHQQCRAVVTQREATIRALKKELELEKEKLALEGNVHNKQLKACEAKVEKAKACGASKRQKEQMLKMLNDKMSKETARSERLVQDVKKLQDELAKAQNELRELKAPPPVPRIKV